MQKNPSDLQVSDTSGLFPVENSQKKTTKIHLLKNISQQKS